MDRTYISARVNRLAALLVVQHELRQLIRRVRLQPMTGRDQMQGGVFQVTLQLPRYSFPAVGVVLPPPYIYLALQRLKFRIPLGILCDGVVQLRRHLNEGRSRTVLTNEVVFDERADDIRKVRSLTLRQTGYELIALPIQHPAELSSVLRHSARQFLKRFVRE